MRVRGPCCLLLAIGVTALSQQVNAQPTPVPQGPSTPVVQFLYNDPNGTPICNGPRGAAPCSVIQQWINSGGLNSWPPPAAPQSPHFPESPPATGGGPPRPVPDRGPNMINVCQNSLPTCPY